MKIRIALLLVLVCSVSFATEVVKPGKPFVSKEEGLFFSLAELNAMKERMEKAEKNEDLLKEYKILVEDYRRMKSMQDALIEKYKDLDKMKQESIQIYRDSIGSYKSIIAEWRENYSHVQKQANTQLRRTRFQRNLGYIIGFLAPVVGARAFNWIK